MNKWFAKIANQVATLAGSSWAFMLAAGTILVWAVTGPIFGFSDTWQLVINTGTTIVTFLMVFLIQNTQNRDQKALHLKMDELLRAVQGARQDLFVDLEDRDEEELKAVKAELLEECGLCLEGAEHERHIGRPVRPRRGRAKAAAA
jgi:low affinity Fe/Cu permease